ncbi:MAG: NUDIX hydrolase [Candidatus Thorarchaeota archaeon]
MTSNHIGFGSVEGTIGGPNIRSVMIEQNRILLYGPEDEDEEYWILPGGGPLFDETIEDAIRRNIREKVGFEIEVQRLLWIMELFFVMRGKGAPFDGVKIHGIGFYYLVSPKTSKSIWQKEEFRGPDPKKRFFKWFKLDEIDNINLYPVCLKQLLNQIPSNPKHVVCRENH